jgi:hypothetical protein
MKRDCQEVVSNLIDIVENNIPESQKKTIKNHVASCPQCTRLVKRFACIWKEFSGAERSMPSEKFWPELLVKIEHYEKPLTLREKIIAGLIRSLRPATVSLIFLLGIFFGYQLGNIPHMETPRSEMSPMEQYVQDFQDFPDGSVSDFYMQYKTPKQQEVP